MGQLNGNSSQQPKINFEEADRKILEEKLTRKKHTSESISLAYYSLLQAAVQHRSMFIDDEITSIRSAPEPTAAEALASLPPFQQKGLRKMTTKTARKAHNDSTEVMVKKLLHTYKKMQEEVDTVTGKMKPEVKAGFDRTVAFISDAVEELLFARDPNELIGLLRMYNNGDLDILFEESRKKAAELYAKHQQANETTPASAE